jgi:hypothetical protein
VLRHPFRGEGRVAINPLFRQNAPASLSLGSSGAFNWSAWIPPPSRCIGRSASLHQSRLAHPRRPAYALGLSVVPWFCMESAYAVFLGILVPGGEPGSHRLHANREVWA